MKTLLFALAFTCALCACNNDSSKTIKINGVEMKTIPGLTAVDVYGNFDKIGFHTTKNLESKPSTWTSTNYELFKDYKVMATGNFPSEIFSVDGSVIYSGSDDIAKECSAFFGYVASIPYKGANQQAAKDWATRNTASGGDTVISEVHFKLIASNEKNRIIKIYAE
jgi:hypothetical protein